VCPYRFREIDVTLNINESGLQVDSVYKKLKSPNIRTAPLLIEYPGRFPSSLLIRKARARVVEELRYFGFEADGSFLSFQLKVAKETLVLSVHAH